MANLLNKTVLVVDDEDDLRALVIENIKKIVTNVYEAADGLTALQIVKYNLIDLILIDIHIPYIDGLSLLKQIKIFNPDIVCVIITGHPGKENLLKALRGNAFDFLEKPFQIEELTAAVIKGLIKGEVTNNFR